MTEIDSDAAGYLGTTPDSIRLVQRDLCWHPQIITQPRFVDFVREVKERFRSL